MIEQRQPTRNNMRPALTLEALALPAASRLVRSSSRRCCSRAACSLAALLEREARCVMGGWVGVRVDQMGASTGL